MVAFPKGKRLERRESYHAKESLGRDGKGV
jgi:hypothetical protein